MLLRGLLPGVRTALPSANTAVRDAAVPTGIVVPLLVGIPPVAVKLRMLGAAITSMPKALVSDTPALLVTLTV